MILELFAENKEKYISFNVMTNVKLTGVSNKDGKEVRKNIHLRFIDSCRFIASSLGKLASNLCHTSGIQCNNYKGYIELINISSKCNALLECKRCKAKKTKNPEK